MDILNFISWIKAGNYRETLPTDVSNLLAVGAKDPSRDDAWLPLAVNATPLQSLYDTGTVTQDPLFNITQTVILNTHSGIITTVSAATTAGAPDIFQLTNSNILSTSIILLSVDYPTAGAGTPVVSCETTVNGSTRIVLRNPDASGALDQPVKIHFMIIN